MVITKRTCILFFCVLLLCAAVAPQALAAGAVDLQQPVSLTITYQESGTKLKDVEFKIYHTATMDENGDLTPTEDFADKGVVITGKNDSAWRTLASTLEGYVIQNQITPTATGQTNENGVLTFTSASTTLPRGLYFVAASRHIQGDYVYNTEPFMVLLPSPDIAQNVWDYDVSVYPKASSKTAVEKDTISRKVLKVWMDKDHTKDRPAEIEVYLYCDSKLHDTVKLNAANNWRYTWSGLESDHQWTVAEKEVDKYTALVEQEGITFVITNTHKDYTPGTPPQTPGGKLPQSGILWWPAATLICVGLIFIAVGILRRRGGKYEK